MLLAMALMVFMAPTVKLLYESAVRVIQTDESEYVNEGIVYLDDNNTDSVEVETPIIIHNNNKTIFPFDDLPAGIYEYDEDINPDSGIYSDEREVSE